MSKQNQEATAEAVAGSEGNASPFDGLDLAALEAARKAIEDVLIEWRNSRMGIVGRGNGFVVCEVDGSPSSIMRLGTPEGLALGIKTYLAALEERD